MTNKLNKLFGNSTLVDPFNRHITYLRLSVTDRCDLRCTYCMPEKMTFLNKKEVLTFEEMYKLCSGFIELGIKKIRITGGEPLVRKGIMDFFEMLKPYLSSHLEELTLTTNGTQLHKYADQLYASGIRRINVSLDTNLISHFSSELAETLYVSSLSIDLKPITSLSVEIFIMCSFPS